MFDFAHLLQSFQSGTLSDEELLTALHKLLTVERVAPEKLLTTLAAQQAVKPLPRDLHAAVLTRISSWPLDATVGFGAAAHSIAKRPESDDEPATIILGHLRPQIEEAVATQRSNQPPVSIGSVLQGRFKLTELIGEGGMSRVYKAIDLRRVEAGAEDPHIAVKVLTAPFGHYFGSISALQREAHKLQSLSHPNIVRVIDCDRDGQTVFMTMEYLPGEPLSRKSPPRSATRLQPAAAEAIVLAIAEALNYAHRNNIVHGDLKPGNVIVTPEGTAKVIDFGMARFIASSTDGSVAADKTGSGAFKADAKPAAVTPRYASPEMLAGQNPEPADDVFSLACVAFQLLSGMHPLERNGQVQRDPQWRPAQPAGMSTTHYRALLHALEFDRQRRTPDVATFIAEFRGAPAASTRTTWPWLLAAVVLIGIGLYSFMRQPKVEPAKLNAGTVLRDCPNCPLLVVLPTGSFKQGASDDAATLPFEQPQHAVSITYPLAMSSNEITVGEYQEFIGATKRAMPGCKIYDGEWRVDPAASWQNPGFEQGVSYPVSCVSWQDATAYAHWLSEKVGHTYRLPSASEWEYAARANGAEQAWAETSAACSYANVADQHAEQQFPGWQIFGCNDGYTVTAPVGSFKSNAFGLNDMLGNVFEWVQDCWHDDYQGAPANGAARMDDNCTEHESRGGSWFSTPAYVRAGYRNRFDTDYRSSSVGFRLVREISQ